jgi:exodeoxyribonuclease V alpha subunit
VESNGYTVMLVKPSAESITEGLFDPDVDGDRITLVGHLSGVRPGDTYEFEGEWTDHPKWGRQVKFTVADLQLPVTHQGAIRYLETIAYGVGPKRAQRIVEELGPDAVIQIRDNPSCLDKLDCLNDEQRSEIRDAIQANAIQAELAALICREGITPAMAAKIYALYGAESIKRVKENPYILAEDLWGVGFKKADQIAMTVGVEPHSQYRIDCAVRYALKEASNQGHVYLKPKYLIEGVQQLCKGSGITIEEIGEALKRLGVQHRVIQEGIAIYDSRLHGAECRLAKHVDRLIRRKPILDYTNRNEWGFDWDIEEAIRDQEQRLDIELAPEQRQAIRIALSHPVSIITGGPGTGKTTVTNTIIEFWKRLRPYDELYLAAPTGKARKRMAEVTGQEAHTIHKLLRYNPEIEGFEYDEINPLPGPGLLIVDEFSMCDVELARALLAAVDKYTQVVIVGDVDQLPSVGPGCVLRDLIDCGRIPVTRLKFNFRQAGGSKIAEYANLVADGQEFPLETSGDFEFIEVSDDKEAAEAIHKRIQELIAGGCNAEDIQILAPMKRSAAGVIKLNDMARELFNPDDGGPAVRGFRRHDKVMVVANNYTLDVFNGDIGMVVDVGRDSVTVDIDDRRVTFADDKLDLLTLAYAATIHKSQGSEFPIVIMPLVKSHYMMLVRNLLYTGMTRAKQRLILVADPWAVKKAINNNQVRNRFSLLADRIQELGNTDSSLSDDSDEIEENEAIAAGA